jgi:hypothetical protein
MKKLLVLLIPVCAFGFSQLIGNPGDVVHTVWFDENFITDDYQPAANTEVNNFACQFIWLHKTETPIFCTIILELYEWYAGGTPIDVIEYDPEYEDAGWDFNGYDVYLLTLDTEGHLPTLQAGVRYNFAFTCWYSGLEEPHTGWPECLEREYESLSSAQYLNEGYWRWLNSDLCFAINYDAGNDKTCDIETSSLGAIKAIWK